MIHFWVPAETASAADLLAWDPDREPGRYASGVGHNLLELFARLHREGLEVTAGEDVPRGTRLVVVFPKSVFQRARLRAVLRAGQRARGRFAVIRSDTPLAWTFPVRPVVEFMPTQSAVGRPWQQWLPPLPQRGLVPRRGERHGRIRSLAFKGHSDNVPDELTTAEWTDQLEARGVEWLLDVAATRHGAGQRWHDFAHVDAVLCVRAMRNAQNIERKPATRLINAWVAGCVPFAEREPGYLELGTEGSDVLFIDTPAGALAAIDRLNAGGDELAGIEERIRRSAAAFGSAATLARWRDALVEAADPRRDATGDRHRSACLTVALGTDAAEAFVGPVLRPARRLLALGRRCAARCRAPARAGALSGRKRT